MWSGRRTDRKTIVVGRRTKSFQNIKGTKRNLPSRDDAAVNLISSDIFDIKPMECSSTTKRQLLQRQRQFFEASSDSVANQILH